MLFKAKDLKRLRARLGYTQPQLAAQLGVDAMTVSRWERGVSVPRRSVQEALTVLASTPSLQTHASGLSSNARQHSIDPGIDELIRMLGLENARKALRRKLLLRHNPTPLPFPVDPALRMRELDRALAEQSDLIGRAKIG